MNIETIRDWLRNFVEDPENRKQMSADIHQQIWNEIQSIELESQKTTNDNIKKGDSIFSVGLKLLSSKINEVVKVYGSESGEMHFKRIK